MVIILLDSTYNVARYTKSIEFLLIVRARLCAVIGDENNLFPYQLRMNVSETEYHEHITFFTYLCFSITQVFRRYREMYGRRTKARL